MRIGNRARKQLGNVSGVANDLLLPPGVDCGILQKNTGSTPMNHSDDPPLGMSAESWRVLSGELDRVLELPESEQQSWLAALHTRDPVSAAWMKRLLAARGSERFADFLQESPGVPVRDLERASLVGTWVGAYQVDAEVGHGGMGSVWRAHRADGSFEGTVALKFLHAYFLGSDGERRFRAEGRLLARLDHPHIARLIDAGVLNGREPYLVLEYVEGEPIDAYCERQALGLEARIRLFLDVLAAVVHAHGHLIVHRDIKPSNILVTAAGTVKLLDFGIAKLLDEGEGVGALSQTRWAALTPLYAAPEQILAQPITTATDVYSLGLVLFRLLTGKHAVVPEDHAGGQALHAILAGNPQRASAVASVAGIPARSLAGDIDNILGKALKRDPAERYSTAQTFADDLRRYLADEPVTARADTWSYRARKLLRRRRGAVLSAAAVAIALVAISGIALWQAHRAGRERDSAVQEARRADSVGDFTIMLLDDFSRDGLLWGRWHSIATRVIARGGAQAVPVLRTEALLEPDANPTGADQLLARAAGLAVDADGVPTPARRDVNVLRAELALRRSEPQAACRLADAIVTQAQREAVDRSSSAWIGEGLLLRARCAKALGDGATMRSSAQVALRQLQDNLGEDHPSTLLARSLAGS